MLGRERAAGAGIGELERESGVDVGMRGCDGCSAMMATPPESGFEVCEIGCTVAFEADGSVSTVFEVGAMESKSAPADSRSIVSRPSNPSSKGRARARQSSGAKLHIVRE